MYRLALALTWVLSSPWGTALAQESGQEPRGIELDRCLTVLAHIGDQGAEIVDFALSTHEPDCPRRETGKPDAQPAILLLDETGDELLRIPIALGTSLVDFLEVALGNKQPLQRNPAPPEEGLLVLKITLPEKATFLTHTDFGEPLDIHHGRIAECPDCVLESKLLTPEVEGAPDEVLDIVILGDGFLRDRKQQRRFENLAEFLTKRLLETEPFSTYKDKIRVNMIPTISNQAGVSDWNNRSERDTCLGLTGGEGGCCGTGSPKKLLNAVGCRVSVDEVDLRVVITNVPLYGGRGLKELRAAYINSNTDQQKQTFANVGIHEIGHALAGLADEYMGCESVEGEKPKWPNVASEADVRNGTVPWQDLWWELATEEERKIGMFKHPLPKAAKKTCPEPLRIPKIEKKHHDKLGLFWGAMYVEGDVSDCGCAVWGDPRGANYYRPTAHCKMRDVRRDFCVVCKRALERAILSHLEVAAE